MRLEALCPFQFLKDFPEIGHLSGCLRRRKGKPPQLVECPLQVRPVDRLQQVINTVHPEGTQGIFIIGRSEDDGARDGDVFKDLESRAVGQMDIQKHHVGHGRCLKPRQAVEDTVQFSHHRYLGRCLCQQSLQVTQGRFLVFNDQCIHIKGSITIK